MTTPGAAAGGDLGHRDLRPGAAVDVVVPASTANLGPGFDSMGMALGVFDAYRAVVREQPGLAIDLGDDTQGVPIDESHLVVATMYRAWAELGVQRPAGLELVCRNTIRMGRGMGSSAAAIVAGVAIAHALTQPEALDAAEGTPIPLDLDAINDLAGALEGHPDNASASVYGGATLSYVDPVDPATGDVPRVHTVRLQMQAGIEPVVFLPAAQLSTATARAVLPPQIPHQHAALNSARVGILTYALTHDPELLHAGTVEWLHQEQRRRAYPEAMALVDALRERGHAAVISGAGPSVLVLTTTDRADAVEAPGETSSTWQRLRPGVPAVGVTAHRATLRTSLGERTVAS